MLSGLEARIQNWDVSKVMLPLKALRKNLSLPELLVVVVQSLNHVRLFAAPWTIACQALLFFTISQSLFKLMPIESVMPSNHLILCYPLLILPAVFPRIRVFCNESVLHIRWPKYWSFSISPSNEFSGLISFRIDWFELLAVQGTHRRLLQHHISKALILRHSAFSSIQLLSHVQLFATPWTAACQASLSITNSQNLPKLMFIESVMPSNYLILCHPLLNLGLIGTIIALDHNSCPQWSHRMTGHKQRTTGHCFEGSIFISPPPPRLIFIWRAIIEVFSE